MYELEVVNPCAEPDRRENRGLGILPPTPEYNVYMVRTQEIV
jgi:hypothetical protein